MDEEKLGESIAQTEMRQLSRRQFMDRMLALGVSAPVAARWLTPAGIARAETREPAFTPTRRGGGGTVKVLMPSAPTLLNPMAGARLEGPLGLPDLLRAARVVRSGWRPRAHPRPGDPQPPERRRIARQPLRHLEAQARRALARRQALHRR